MEKELNLLDKNIEQLLKMSEVELKQFLIKQEIKMVKLKLKIKEFYKEQEQYELQRNYFYSDSAEDNYENFIKSIEENEN